MAEQQPGRLQPEQPGRVYGVLATARRLLNLHFLEKLCLGLSICLILLLVWLHRRFIGRPFCTLLNPSELEVYQIVSFPKIHGSVYARRY